MDAFKSSIKAGFSFINHLVINCLDLLLYFLLSVPDTATRLRENSSTYVLGGW